MVGVGCGGSGREVIGRVVVVDEAVVVVVVCLCRANLGSRNRLIASGIDLGFVVEFIEKGFDDGNANDEDNADADIEGEEGLVVVGGDGDGDMDDEDVVSRRWVCCRSRSF